MSQLPGPSPSSPRRSAWSGIARTEGPVIFSQRAYLFITLGISVAFGLLVLPSSVLPRPNLKFWQILLLFVNGVLFFQIPFCTNYLLRYLDNPVQRWLRNQLLWLDRLVRTVVTVLVFSLYIIGRHYLDIRLGIRLDNIPLLTELLVAQVLMAVGLPFQVAIELVERSRYLAIENESLKREQLQARYDSLKQQLSPHFLFNSLATLDELIDDEPKNAKLFVGEMAQVYRYLLQHGERAAVPLHEELSFLQSYAYLLRMRFGEGLQLKIDLPTSIQDRLVPPLALQLLLENAVKHNAVSHRMPLTVHLDFVAPATLRVRNTRYPRLTPEPSSGVGLANLTNRIRLLNHQKLTLEQTAVEFIVYLPLPA